MRKKLSALLLCAAMAFSAISCAPKENRPAPGEIEFWSTYATEKVLRDRTDIYDGVKFDAAVNADALKGEYEHAQLIMTASKAVGAFNAELTGDLTGADGAVFKKENVSIRQQMYIEVKNVYSGYNNPPKGWYPDALLPIEKSVEYGENKIAEGENQGLYVTFDVPVDQKAGLYTGNIKITYDGKEKLVPVSLNVRDLTVSQTTRSKSYFNLGFSQHLGDLDSSQNMWRTYAETLLEYRISPSIVIRNHKSTEAGLKEYVDEVYYLVKNHDMSTINCPWKRGDELKNFLIALAKKSIETKTDLLALTIAKGPDEPPISQLNTVKTFTADFHTAVNNAIAAFDGLKTDGVDQAFIDELKASAKKIPLIITLVHYGRNEATDAANIDTYCPIYDKYDTQEDRDKYADQTKGRWWYGCVSPRPPYPTYHTEDTLVSARSVGWMMSEYDVIGNLYWAVSVYARYNGVSYQPIEDFYNGSAERFPDVNGDGYLFYPGAPYGLTKPVASMRIEAIRDGNEEFEILYDLSEAYKAQGESLKAVQRSFSDLIYSGTKVRYENVSEQFAAARRAVIELAELAYSPANVLITDVKDDNKGTVTFGINAKKGYTIKNNGEILSGTDNGDRTVYELKVKLDKVENALHLSTEADGKTYVFDFNLGGKVDYRTAGELLNENNTFADGTATANAELNGDKIVLNVGAVSGKHQSVRYNSAVLKGISATDKKLVLFLNNPTGSETTLRILVKQKNYALNSEMYNGTLAAGENVIEIDLSTLNMAARGGIEFADLYFSSAAGDHAAKTVEINGLAVYGA